MALQDGYPKRIAVPSDGSHLDAFSRQRVSNPAGRFDYQSQYNKGPLFWFEKITNASGNASSTHNNDRACVILSVEADDTIIRQTKAYFRYQPGKSHLIMATHEGWSTTAGVTRRVGYFDGDNGVFLEDDGSDISFVCRSKATGSIVDTAATQASDWNLDKFDGNGPSGLTLDITKAQIVVIDLEWLGVGRVRVGFSIAGQIFYAHEFLNANTTFSTVYMSTANLPIRYEISAGSAVVGVHTLCAICSQVSSEGGADSELGVPETAGNGIATIAVTTRRPIFSIQPKLLFNSITNRSTIIIDTVDVRADTNDAFIEIAYDGALTNDTFAVDPGGTVEGDIAATAISGGTVIRSFPVSTSGSGNNAKGADSKGLTSKLPIVLDIDGSNPIIVSIAATSFSSTSNVSGSFSWREEY